MQRDRPGIQVKGITIPGEALDLEGVEGQRGGQFAYPVQVGSAQEISAAGEVESGLAFEIGKLRSTVDDGQVAFVDIPANQNHFLVLGGPSGTGDGQPGVVGAAQGIGMGWVRQGAGGTIPKFPINA